MKQMTINNNICIEPTDGNEKMTKKNCDILNRTNW